MQYMKKENGLGVSGACVYPLAESDITRDLVAVFGGLGRRCGTRYAFGRLC